MIKALVTGGTGFIGANLVRRLVKEEIETSLIARPGSLNHWRLEGIRDNIRFYEADLLDTDGIQEIFSKVKPDYVFHLAAYGTYPFQKDFRKILEVNILGTVNLLETAEKRGFKKFVATGTSSEYGQKTKAMAESDVLEPDTLYGVSKAAATMYCQSKARTADLPIVVLRPFSVYGPWEEPTRLFPTIVRKALLQEDIELVSPEVARDYVYVDDIIDGLLSCLKNDKVDGRVLNLCSGQQTTIKQVADTLFKVSASSSKPLWGSHEGRSYDKSVWIGDPAKAQKLLGWKPQINLEQGIEKMIDWYKDHKQYYEG